MIIIINKIFIILNFIFIMTEFINWFGYFTQVSLPLDGYREHNEYLYFVKPYSVL